MGAAGKGFFGALFRFRFRFSGSTSAFRLFGFYLRFPFHFGPYHFRKRGGSCFLGVHSRKWYCERGDPPIPWGTVWVSMGRLFHKAGAQLAAAAKPQGPPALPGGLAPGTTTPRKQKPGAMVPPAPLVTFRSANYISRSAIDLAGLPTRLL